MKTQIIKLHNKDTFEIECKTPQTIKVKFIFNPEVFDAKKKLLQALQEITSVENTIKPRILMEEIIKFATYHHQLISFWDFAEIILNYVNKLDNKNDLTVPAFTLITKLKYNIFQ